MNVTGTSGPRSHSATVEVIVTSSSNGGGGPLGTLFAYMTSYPGIITLIALSRVIVFVILYAAKRNRKITEPALPRAIWLIPEGP